MTWQYETTGEKLARLRSDLARAHDDLIEAEAEFADRMADVHAFERLFEAEVGRLIDELASVEAEVEEYLRRIQSLRDETIFGHGYQSVQEQYRRTWEVPPESSPMPPSEPLPPASEAQVKKLYRQLARRYHPDLANSDEERAYRTDKMQAINDAYAARSMVELVALSQEIDEAWLSSSGATLPGQTDAEMVKALQDELYRVRQRISQIDMELRNLHNRPSVEMSLEIKFARREGRDLLAEMAADLERKIGRKTAERDMIKAQFDSMRRQS